MNNSEIYNRIFGVLDKKLELLPDKPEETVEATLKALWHLASGTAYSVETAVQKELPRLEPKQVLLLEKYVDERLRGVPLAYITGRQQFMGIELIANSKALIPRKETEILGKLAVQKLKEKVKIKGAGCMVFDICCGAGNLAVAMAINEPSSRIYAADLSEDAVSLARENIDFHGLQKRVEVYPGDLFEPFDNEGFYNKVDMIVCNPPYISDFKVPKMAKEISDYEPQMAFKGGGLLGMNIVQKLIRRAPDFLADKGILMFEIGLGQGEYVMNLCKKTGHYREIFSAADDNGAVRVVGVVK